MSEDIYADESAPPRFDSVMVTIEIDNQIRLFILLARDGTINRRGNGSLADPDAPLCVGMVDESVFRTFASQVPGHIFKFQGIYDLKDKPGKPARLILAFKDDETGQNYGFEIRYGSESPDVPQELMALVNLASRLTGEWYAETLSMQEDV
jgi:hypothetical protein